VGGRTKPLGLKGDLTVKPIVQRMNRERVRALLFAVLAVAGGGLGALSSASASTTVVLPNPGGEPSLATPGGILDQLYGLGNVSRVNDALDQKWLNPGSATAILRAKYSGYSQTFGFVTGGALFVPLFTVTGNGLFDGPGTGFSSAESGTSFGWGDDPNGAAVGPDLWRDVEADNADGLDHMVTYLITGSLDHPDNHVGAYVIAFEDLPGGGDRDYNDLVVEVRGPLDAPSDAPSVPAPATLVLLLGAGAGAVGLGSLRRRLRQGERA
jgi:hypothetical protein